MRGARKSLRVPWNATVAVALAAGVLSVAVAFAAERLHGEAPLAATRPVTLAHEDDPDSGAELIGTLAPRWSFDRWARGRPMALENLRGKVVLLRWWTEGCRFCETTLPALDRLRRDHPADDLVVIGVFHPKPPRAVSDRHVLAAAERLGFGGPVAVDREWSTLERYWLAGHPEHNWTSVSFLIGRDGTIRWVHGGGEYHPSTEAKHARCAIEYRGLERAVAEALAEPRASTATGAN